MNAGMCTRNTWGSIARLACVIVFSTVIVAWLAPNALAASSISISIQTAVPEQAVPVQLSFSGNADPVDSSGDGPALFAVVRPAGGIGCQPSFGADQTAAGSASTALTGDFGVNEPPGPYQVNETFNPSAAGPYLICAWLGSSANTTTAGPVSATFSARGPQVPQLSINLPSAPKPHVTFQINYTTQTDQQLTLYSIIKAAGALPCASSFDLEQQQNQSETTLLGDFGTSVFGGPTLTTATDTESRGPYIICTWVQGPTNGEVDAMQSTPIDVGTPPPPPRGSPALRLTYAWSSRQRGVSVRGTTAAKLSGRVVVVASCARAARSTRPLVRNGRFSTHLRFPHGCGSAKRLLLSATWPGSRAFAYQSVSERLTVHR